MRPLHLSFKMRCLLTAAGMVLSMMTVAVLIGLTTNDIQVFVVGGMLTICALVWMFVLVLFFRKRLSIFTYDLCQILDDMMDGNEEPRQTGDGETLFARIVHRLVRMYGIMQENRHKVERERQELQSMVSDISHQVKTPISNLKLVTDILLSMPVSEQERTEFLQGIKTQTDKLDFLIQALVKTSRLEIGAICLEKKDSSFYHTLAQAMSGIVYDAERKGIAVTVDCPEDMHLCHDSKWTSEAIFNLLDNAVKYTPDGGKIHVSVEQWEMYVKVDVSDTGRGIPESSHAIIFQRFYREQDVHDEQGAGIGLFLAREIITRQGGYIRVQSEVGKGSTFSMFLPYTL